LSRVYLEMESIQDLLHAEASKIICGNSMSCENKPDMKYCCLSCEDFKTCKNPCKSAQTWDIHLKKCHYAEVEE